MKGRPPDPSAAACIDINHKLDEYNAFRNSITAGVQIKPFKGFNLFVKKGMLAWLMAPEDMVGEAVTESVGSSFRQGDCPEFVPDVQNGLVKLIASFIS